MANKKKKSDVYTGTTFWIIIMSVFITELLFYTWCRVQCINTGYTITHANKIHRELSSLHKNLEIELAQLKSPNRIAKIAKDQLGLDLPKPEQIRSIP